MSERFLLLLFVSLFSGLMAFAGDQPAYKMVVSLGAVTIPTASWYQIDSSLDASCSKLDIFNSTASPIYFAVGPASSESDLNFAVGPGGGFHQVFQKPLAKGLRFSARAIGANATSGFLIVNCLQ